MDKKVAEEYWAAWSVSAQPRLVLGGKNGEILGDDSARIDHIDHASSIAPAHRTADPRSTADSASGNLRDMSDAQTRFIINAENPNRSDVVELLRAHLAFAQEVTPEGHVHALPVHRMVDPGITLVSARDVGLLVGIGALKHLDDEHAEIKSMHTTGPARGQGVGRALLNHLISIARERGYRRVSLETGTMPAFAPARSLYARAGFRTCPPFGEYTMNPHSVCMSLGLDA